MSLLQPKLGHLQAHQHKHSEGTQIQYVLQASEHWHKS